MDSLAALNADIYTKGSVNREHIFGFLRIQTTSDRDTIKKNLEIWLQGLHDDPYYSKIHFPNDTGTDSLGVHNDSLQRVIDDLVNYDRVTHDTIIDAPSNIMPDINTIPDSVV